MTERGSEAVPEQPLRILVTGSREFADDGVILEALRQVARENPGRHLIIVHGAAPGADTIAAGIAAAHPDHLTSEPHPAAWRTANGKVNRGAGPQRNQAMVDLGADICLAFHQTAALNSGTRDCSARARKAGIEVRDYANQV